MAAPQKPETPKGPVLNVKKWRQQSRQPVQEPKDKK